MSDDELLRLECIREALKRAAHPNPIKVLIAEAQKIYDFCKNKEDKP